MPWVELNGERKKVACGPCIRGHRSSKCEHKDRVLLEVRKPGRPLSSCPHPPGSCSCERVVINYTIPKKSDCNCSSSESTPVGNVSAASTPAILGNGSSRVQKPRQKRASTSFNPAAVARALNEKSSGTTGETVEIDDSPRGSDSSNDGPTASTSNGHSVDSDTQLSVKMEDTGSNQPQIQQASCCGGSEANGSTTIGTEKTILDQNGTAAKANGVNGTNGANGATGSCCGGAKNAPEVQPATKSCCSGPTKISVSTSAPTAQPDIRMINSMPPPQSPVRQSMNGPSSFMSSTPYSQYTPNGAGLPASPYGYPPNGVHVHQNSYFPPNPQDFHDIRTTAMSATQPSPMNHNCNCGDGCTCLGCASHPRNNTTTEYIRYYSQFLTNPGPAVGRPPPYQVHNPYMASNGHFGYQPHGMPNGYVQQLYMGAHPNGHAHPSINHHPGQIIHQDPWQMNSLHSPVQATPTAELEQMNFLTQGQTIIKPNGKSTEEPHISMHENGFEGQSPQDTSESDQSHEQSPAAGAGSPTLSPSSFFLQTLELPGCDDPTGTCQCGDGCACVGCLTHGGHNGISLVQDTDEQQEPLNFDYNPDFNIESFTDGPG